MGGMAAIFYISYQRKRERSVNIPAIPLEPINNNNQTIKNSNNNINGSSPTNKVTDNYSDMAPKITAITGSSNNSNDNNSKEKKGNQETKDKNSNNSSSKNKTSGDDLPMIPENSIVIKQQIGKGDYGTVYYGQWQGTPVALKVNTE